jgi:hypothetical protein
MKHGKYGFANLRFQFLNNRQLIYSFLCNIQNVFSLLVRSTHFASLNTYIISCFDCYYVIIKPRTSRIGFCEGVCDGEVNRTTQRCVLNESF